MTISNIEDPQQRAEFEQLTRQDHLLMLVFDDRLKERVRKRVGYRGVPCWREPA